MVAPSYTPRRNAGLAAYENVLARAGLAPVAGIDEAGRGACAGPLVVAAVVLDQSAIKRMPGLADSKLLTPAVREDLYARITQKAVELLGPLGYSRKILVEKWMRDAKINDIFEGTQQINMIIIARRILNYSSKELN